MESTASSISRKDTLVAFRVAAADVEYLKRSVEDDYKDGLIEVPTLAALAKHLLYRHLRMLKDIEKARMLKYQQPKSSHYSTPAGITTTLRNQMSQDRKEDYDENYDEGSVLNRPFF